MDEMDENQNFTNRKGEIAKDLTSILSQHEDLRRATLIKHRKVSTQLKLDMIQRQLSTLRRAGGHNSERDRQFYRSQVAELSSELHDLGSTLDQAERHAFYAKKRLMRHCGISLDPLSASNPALWTSAEDLRGSRGSLKTRVRHLMSASPKFGKKRNFFGELRAAASLSSLNLKSGSPTTSDDSNSDPPSSNKDAPKSWMKKSPFRFLGHLVDTRFRRSFWRRRSKDRSRTKSADNILEDNKEDAKDEDVDEEDEVFGSSSSSEESEEEGDWRTVKVVPRYAVRGPVMRKVSSHQKAQVDPAVLAEIEDFERMAENYIKQHS